MLNHSKITLLTLLGQCTEIFPRPAIVLPRLFPPTRHAQFHVLRVNLYALFHRQNTEALHNGEYTVSLLDLLDLLSIVAWKVVRVSQLIKLVSLHVRTMQIHGREV